MSSTDNLTAVLYKVNDLRLEQRPIPEPDDDQVLLQMACVGICGSDVHYLVRGRCADFVVEKPMIMGHEASGIVAKVGKNVKHLKKGDRVAIEPGVPCRFCQFCKEGKYNLCADMVFCATPPVHGNLSRYYVHAADFCYKLPDHVSLEEGALLEPLSVGVHACRRGGVGLGSKILITGAGTIGLVTLITAKAMGAAKVLITDIVDHRLGVAKEMGADFTYLSKPGEDEKEVVKTVHSILGGPPDITIDCTGVDANIRIAILATKSGGVAVIVGMGKSEVSVPLANALAREVDIRGIFRYANDAYVEVLPCGQLTREFLDDDYEDYHDTIYHNEECTGIEHFTTCSNPADPLMTVWSQPCSKRCPTLQDTVQKNIQMLFGRLRNEEEEQKEEEEEQKEEVEVIVID